MYGIQFHNLLNIFNTIYNISSLITFFNRTLHLICTTYRRSSSWIEKHQSYKSRLLSLIQLFWDVDSHSFDGFIKSLKKTRERKPNGNTNHLWLWLSFIQETFLYSIWIVQRRSWTFNTAPYIQNAVNLLSLTHITALWIIHALIPLLNHQENREQTRMKI